MPEKCVFLTEGTASAKALRSEQGRDRGRAVESSKVHMWERTGD